MEDLYKEITGEAMTKYYRPPQGKIQYRKPSDGQGSGLPYLFWSLAYVDWIEDEQPSKEEAFDKLLTRIHPGAVVLLHSTSKTNAEILDELLAKWEEMGYTFKSLDQFGWQIIKILKKSAEDAICSSADESTHCPARLYFQPLL